MDPVLSPTFDDIVHVAAALGRQLASVGAQITTAESCTGGLIATALTEVSGSSHWFDRGFVTYSNDAKTSSIGVDASLIHKFGAVSEEVARAMALGALKQSCAKLALSVTGVAGPNGGSLVKPVGTIWFGWAIVHNEQVNIESQCLLLTGDRAEIRRKTALHSLQVASEITRKILLAR